MGYVFQSLGRKPKPHDHILPQDLRESTDVLGGGCHLPPSLPATFKGCMCTAECLGSSVGLGTMSG